MIKVLFNGKEIEHTCICNNCNSVLRYTDKDIFTPSDYIDKNGTRHIYQIGYRCIKCPECGFEQYIKEE